MKTHKYESQNYIERHACLSVAVLKELHRFHRDFHPFEDTTLKQKNWQNLGPLLKCQSDGGLLCVWTVLVSCANVLCVLACMCVCACACDKRKESHREPEKQRNCETASGGGRRICSRTKLKSKAISKADQINRKRLRQWITAFVLRPCCGGGFFFFLVGALLVLSWLCPFCLSSGRSWRGKHFTAVLHHPDLTSREMQGRLKGSHASDQPAVVHNALFKNLASYSPYTFSFSPVRNLSFLSHCTSWSVGWGRGQVVVLQGGYTQEHYQS